MAKRLTKIVTRGGDQGETSLGEGNRVAKDSARIEAIGSIDELNSFIGLFVAGLTKDCKLYPLFRGIQNDLFDLGGELAMPGHLMINEAHWGKLEDSVEQLNESLPALDNFILPGGSESVSRCHVVRSVSRRAERRLITLAHDDEINQHSRIYLNRLSDLCFVAARWLSKAEGEEEVLWQPSTLKAPENKDPQ